MSCPGSVRGEREASQLLLKQRAKRKKKKERQKIGAFFHTHQFWAILGISTFLKLETQKGVRYRVSTHSSSAGERGCTVEMRVCGVNGDAKPIAAAWPSPVILLLTRAPSNNKRLVH